LRGTALRVKLFLRLPAGGMAIQNSIFDTVTLVR